MPFLRFKQARTSRSPSTPIVELFEQLEGPLLAYAARITNDAELAQDVVQEAFIKLHQSPTAIETPKAWLYRTVHNLAINQSKRRSREVSLEAARAAPQAAIAESADDLPPGRDLERQELADLARLLIAQLDARSRAVVELKFKEELNYKEIADRLQLSVSNVGYILHHAVKSLADEFNRMGVSK